MTVKPLIITGEDLFDCIKEVFARGGIIAFPTETFYGLCVDPFNPTAIQALFNLKGRPELNPVALIVKDAPMLDTIVSVIPPVARSLMDRFWPGPLTIIFKAGPGLSMELTAGTGTIGARVSSNVICQRLVASFSSPITATSANPSGLRAATTAQEVIAYFNGSIDVVIDGKETPGGHGSTVVDVTNNRVKIIREGVIPSSSLFIK
ncbi:MAG: threonylcarbamoyl-AMP synthase [Deltaproteobacteria bacterium]|nr:threonylcarbamoyl-AMP synthase [Deltaproteobacteria bacterium]